MLEKYKKENKVNDIKQIETFENEIELATFLFVCISTKDNRYNFLQLEREEILNTILNTDFKYLNIPVFRAFIGAVNKYKWQKIDLVEVLEIADLKDFLKDIDLTINIETLVTRFTLDNTVKNIQKLKKAYIVRETIKMLEDKELILNVEKNILRLGEEIREEVKTVREVFFREQCLELLKENKEEDNIIVTNTVLDMVLKLYRQEVFYISGEPGTGKTSFVLDMALKLEKSGYSGIFFSLEMAKSAIGNRALAISTGIPVDKFSNGEESLMQYLRTELKENEKEIMFKRFQKFNEKVRRLEIVDTSTLHVDELERYVKNTMALRKIDYIVVDYLQCLEGKGSNDTEKTTYISKKLKQVAKDNGIVVISTVQMNNEAKKGSQNASRNNQENYKLYGTSLKGSSQLDQDAGAILFLTKKADDPSLFRLVNLQIAKQRNFRTFDDLEVEYHLPTQSFLYRRMVERFNYVKPQKKQAEEVKEVKKDEEKVVVEQQKML